MTPRPEDEPTEVFGAVPPDEQYTEVMPSVDAWTPVPPPMSSGQTPTQQSPETHAGAEDVSDTGAEYGWKSPEAASTWVMPPVADRPDFTAPGRPPTSVWQAAPQPWESAPQPWQSAPDPGQAAPQPWQSAPDPWQSTPQPWQSTPQPWQSAPDPWAQPSAGWGQQPVPAGSWAPPTGAPWGAQPNTWTPTRVSAVDRTWAPAAHWLPLLTHWVGPLIVLLTAGRRSERVRAEATASLNWEITVAILLAVATALAPFGIVAPALAIAVILVSIGMHVTGAVIVARGGRFSYPGALPFIA